MASIMHRPLFCPICGARLTVEVAKPETLPEVHRLPEHMPAPGSGVNLCCAMVITVTIGYDACSICGQKMGKHPTGICRECYATGEWVRRHLGT